MISTDQIKELQRALRILKSRLYVIELKKHQEKKIEWGSQIRSTRYSRSF